MARILPIEMVEPLESEPGLEVYTPKFLGSDFSRSTSSRRRSTTNGSVGAVSQAVDREAITESILGGSTTRGRAVLPEITAWANPDLEDHRYDPDQARELLSEAGWALESGTFERVTARLTIEIVTFDARSLP